MKKFIFISSLCLSLSSLAGTISEGEKADLTCRLKEGFGKTGTTAEVKVKEVKTVTQQEIPEEVPNTFTKSMAEDQYVLRQFLVTGKVHLIGQNGSTLVERDLNHTFYGNLSYPDFADGITRVGAYGSYAKERIFRAFTIRQARAVDTPSIQLYYSNRGASNISLDCSGTLPVPTSDKIRPGVVRLPAFHRSFACQLKANQKHGMEAINFNMGVTNLQNQRLLRPIDFEDEDNGWFLNAPSGMGEHILNGLNDGDAHLLLKGGSTSKPRLISRYYDECGEPGCYMVELDLPYPQESDTSITGSFRYKVDTDDDYKLHYRSTVTCDISELNI